MTGGVLRVAVVCGGPSSEAEVSRTSAAGVMRALSTKGHEAVAVELEATLGQRLSEARFDVVFPVTHGPLGEDGCLQGLLEVLGLPYVGSGVLASALAMSKPHAKAQFRSVGLPVAPDAVVGAGEDLRVMARRARSQLGPAVVVKPAASGSALGVSRVAASDPDDALVLALERALESGSYALVERFVVGQEVTCGVLEDDEGRPRALPPTLILPRASDWYDFRSRYADGGSEHRCPAPFSSILTQSVQRVAVEAHAALGARDLSRVDFVVGDGDDEQALTLLELNTLPGMTATSNFPEAAAVSGVPFVELCDRLVRRAHARPARRPPSVEPMP